MLMFHVMRWNKALIEGGYPIDFGNEGRCLPQT